MNTNELKSFLMVYENRSYTLAANRLFVTQSTISKRINSLENEFKVKLFETRGKMVFPTMEGTLLIPYARLLLHTMYNATDDLRNPDLSEVPVVIGVSPYPSLQFLPLFITYLTEKNINIPKFFIKQVLKRDIIQSLQAGIVDLVLTSPSHDLVINSALSCTPLVEEELIIVVSPNHELADKKKMDLKTLANYSCIMPEHSFFIRECIERVFDKQGLQLLVNHELFSFDGIKQLVKTGLGWSLLPKYYCDDELIRLEIKDFSEKIKINIYCHQNRANSRIIQYVGQLLKESLPNFHQKCIG